MVCRRYNGARGVGLIYAQSHNDAETVAAALDSGDPERIAEHGWKFVSWAETPQSFQTGVAFAVAGCERGKVVAI